MKHKNYIQYLMKETEIAMRVEVMAAPKPGLVDRNNSGSHEDMDLNSFLRSTKTLAPWFGRIMEIAQASPKDLVLPGLRKIGQEAEEAMYQATGGVNTHKGLIFSMGLISACLVRLRLKLNRTPSFKDVLKLQELICLNTKDLTQELKTELKNKENNRNNERNNELTPELKKAPLQGSKLDEEEKLRTELKLELNHQGSLNQSLRQATSHGEAVYANFGLKGIREEAEEGYPAVFEVGLPAYLKFLEQFNHRDLALVLTLLELILATDDTNLVKRGGLEGLAFMRAEAAKILRLAPHLNEEALINQLLIFDKAAIEKNLSPGGAADNLALTIFLYRVLGS